MFLKSMSRWSELEGYYFAKYKAVLEESLLKTTRSPDDPKASVAAFCEPFGVLEMWSTALVMTKGFLKGIRRNDLLEAGATVPTHPEAFRVLDTALKNGTQVHIVSANWSADLIAGCLSRTFSTYDALEHSNDVDEKNRGSNGDGLTGHRVSIFSNTLRFAPHDGISTGELIRRVSNGFQKQNIAVKLNALKGPGELSVYIGDSIMDMLAMLECDIGIVVGTNNTLGRVCHHLGIPIVPLDGQTNPCKLPSQVGKEASGRVLYRAASWEDIGALLSWREKIQSGS